MLYKIVIEWKAATFVTKRNERRLVCVYCVVSCHFCHSRPRLRSLREPMIHHQVPGPFALNGVEPKRGDVKHVTGLHLHLQPPHLREPRISALVGFPKVYVGDSDVVKGAAAVGSLLDFEGFEISGT